MFWSFLILLAFSIFSKFFVYLIAVCLFLYFMLGALFGWVEFVSGGYHLTVSWLFHWGTHKYQYLCFYPQASQIFLKGILHSPPWCVTEAGSIFLIVWERFNLSGKWNFCLMLAEVWKRRCEDPFRKHIFNWSFKSPWSFKFPSSFRVLRHESFCFLSTHPSHYCIHFYLFLDC